MTDARKKTFPQCKEESININFNSNDFLNKSDTSEIGFSTLNKKGNLTEIGKNPKRRLKQDDAENISENFHLEKDKMEIQNYSEKSVIEINLVKIIDETNYEDIKNNLELKQKDEIPVDENITLPRYKRCLLFIFIVFVNVCVNLDEGNIPAATEHIRKELHISPSQLGLFGSLSYSGNCLGSIISMIIINKFNRKILLIIFLVSTGIGLWTFTLTKNVGFLYFNRIILGVFQSFITIYCPVWVDQYGPRNKKTMMMSFLQIGSPFGVVLGYTITTLIIRSGVKWQLSFIIQAVIFAIFSIINIFLPNIYFSKTLKCINSTNVYLDEEKKNKNKEIASVNIITNTGITEKNKIIDEVVIQETLSLYQHNIESDHKLKHFWINLCRLVKIKVYMIGATAISVLLFISCAIQFWTTDYLTVVMKIDRSIVFPAFVATCITAPTSGVIIGGCIIQKLGGYETRKSMFICCIFAFCAVLCGIPISLFDSIVGFAIFLWLFLFFGGCIIPNLIGITLTSLPIELRAAGNSVTVFLNTILGFLPAPFTYGVIYESTRKHSPRFAYGFIIMYSTVALTLIIIGAILREKEFKKKMKEEKEKTDQLEMKVKNPEIDVTLNPSNESNSKISLKSQNENKDEINSDYTEPFRKLNSKSSKVLQKMTSDDLLENISRNEKFVHHVLDNSINVRGVKTMAVGDDITNDSVKIHFDNQLIKGTINKTNTEECKYNNNSLFKKNKNHDLESDTLSFSLKKFVSKTGRNKKLDF